ncbi:PIG-L family deacetylase [Granulicoccus phenolivorans]|uniref:PIG-L family deacetylase n=1 Tax=Granulicoccus phenolivorans TaxID=266854 RepID=UPI000404C280|nr:PIG-L family deacetylase [Granulicoccus phenolivorans]
MLLDDLAGAARVLFVHAHPDDETLQTGALIAELTARGVRCDLVTATRGERGEIVPGPLSGLTGDAFVARRETELAGAVAALGITERAYLGEPPARAAGQPPRRYADSGMRWIREGLAGPSGDAGPDSFTAADPAEEVADLVAAIEYFRPDALISYDDDGSYGHPDHVRVHEISGPAAARAGVPVLWVVSDPAGAGEWSDLAHRLPTVVAAARCHASQVSVVESADPRAAEVIHSGGQRTPLATRIGLRR